MFPSCVPLQVDVYYTIRFFYKNKYFILETFKMNNGGLIFLKRVFWVGELLGEEALYFIMTFSCYAWVPVRSLRLASALHYRDYRSLGMTSGRIIIGKIPYQAELSCRLGRRKERLQPKKGIKRNGFCPGFKGVGKHPP